ncbi:hypothetical protein AMECASPLE_039081 [Ameca splendens]|uniref:Uncharacterized protein n=1 Tax=Ameca splendens TaxID=208324 RepID=A0ABV0Z711_9TELE
MYFVGKPADLYNRTNPDWALSWRLTHTATPSETDCKPSLYKTNLKRYKREKDQRHRNEYNTTRTRVDLHNVHEPGTFYCLTYHATAY